ncbi:MAG: hypothetical protein ACTHN0_18965 [Aquihabitans sp.]
MPPAVPSTSGRTSQAPWNNPTTADVPAEGAPLVVATRPLDGILTGLAASALAGVLWWAGASAVAKNQPDFGLWPLGSILVGLIVGVGVLVGSRRGGLVSGLIALVLSTATVLVTVYFIDRSITISAFAAAGRTSDIPLWQGASAFTDVYRDWWDYDRNHALMWLGAPIVAVLVAGWPGRRPVGG